MKTYLSVVIPCYNEKKNLERGVLEEVEDFLSKKKLGFEVLISDDGSTDGSREEVKRRIAGKENFKLLENPHGGKPSALFYGLKKAQGEMVLFTDMDQSTPIAEVDKLLPYFENGYSVVIGSRGMGRKNFPLYRQIGSFVFRSFRQIFLLHSLGDTQCGFKAFKTEVVRDVFSKLSFFDKTEAVSGWRVTSYDVELLFLLSKKGYKIAEVPVTWADRDVAKGKGGHPLKKYFKESKEMLLEVIRIKMNDLRGGYDS